MNKKTAYFLLLIFISIYSSAQDYNVNLIPDSLSKNASTVKRFEEYNIVVKDIDKAIIRHRYVITILNEQGDNLAFYKNSYSKELELNDISGNLYDASGKKIKSVRKKDIEDVPADDGFSLMLDTRIKYHNFYYRQYPYSIEYEDEQVFNGILILPEWDPVANLKMSVQHSSYRIEYPVDYKIRYKEFNCRQKSKILNEKTNTYTSLWDTTDLKVYAYEPLSPDYHERMPCVYLAPTDFSYGGYSGKMDTWLNYGKYQIALNNGRDELPDNVKADVHRLTDRVTDKKEKIKTLYEYLQKNTRYISIQLGIGGLQPFDAKYVASKKYGDCKALSNYMNALLKEAGIKGYYTQINSGRDNKFYMPDFPSDQSNHIIVCIPLEKDTMWLECTDQNIAAGFLGHHTDNRYALIIKEDGGYLVKTPKYGTEENKQICKINGVVDETGTFEAKIETVYTGLEQDALSHYINALSHEKLEERLKNNFDFPTYNINSFSYNEHKKIIPLIKEDVNVTVNNYASVSGKRLFISPNIVSKNSLKLDAMEKRQYDIVYKNAFTYTDTISIKIPSGYNIESMPKDVVMNNKFGSYEIHFKVDGDNIGCTRLYKRSEGRFPPSDYTDLVKFYESMYKADRSRIVFIKKEG